MKVEEEAKSKQRAGKVRRGIPLSRVLLENKVIHVEVLIDKT